MINKILDFFTKYFFLIILIGWLYLTLFSLFNEIYNKHNVALSAGLAWGAILEVIAIVKMISALNKEDEKRE